MRLFVAGLLLIFALASAPAQRQPSDSASIILVTGDTTGAVSLGGKVAAATRAILTRRLRDPKLWVVPDPFYSLSADGPPAPLPFNDVLELGKTLGAAIIIEIVATPQQSALPVRATPWLVLRQSPPIALGVINAADVESAADALAEHIASDSALRQRAIDDGRLARAAHREVFFEFQVDREARLVDPKQRPRYPEELRAQKLDGEVLAQFVVDSSGRVDLTTFKILKSSEPAFSRAVREMLGENTFVPAERRGHRVNQLVQMPFQFLAPKKS